MKVHFKYKLRARKNARRGWKTPSFYIFFTLKAMVSKICCIFAAESRFMTKT